MAQPNPLLHQPLPVDLRAIERELEQLWKSAEGEAVVRACAVNLLVYVRDQETEAQVTQVVAQLPTRHPCRAIVLREHLDTQGQLDAWVQAHCLLPAPGQPQVCSEQITIAASSDQVNRLPSAALALLVADLPAALWWPGLVPWNSSLFQSLSALADRIILDSASFPALAPDLAALAALVQQYPASTSPYRDLSWGRLTVWRQLIAKLFDPVEHRSYLDQLQRVSIHYSGENPVQALLLGGWLRSRLGRPLAVSTAAQPGAPGGVTSVQLWAGDTVFTVGRTPDSDCVKTSIQSSELGQRQYTTRFAAPDEVTLLSAELDLLGCDQMYGEALGQAQAILRAP
ncbi:MAG: glucose-6-phosphate dehydrogenase assembly protein OpcA [Deinococcus sp.]|nr:glucose-6-phosphate dehydrogenase assembly protein OpcA [Deinococcus sp.]